MKVRDLLKEEIDIDVYDDYDERCGIAFCGPCKLTAKGKRKFAAIMDNEVKIYAPLDIADIAVISCENEHEAQIAKYLFHGFAGFIPSEEWETLFVE